MARRVDAAKRQAWHERLRRFGNTRGLTVAAFCRDEQVSVPSFYQWRKKLAAPKSARSLCSPTQAPRTFLPVRLVSSTSASSVPATLEVRLPNGARVCLSAPSASGLLAAAIAAAGQAPAMMPSANGHPREDARC